MAEGWFRSKGGNVEQVIQACTAALLHDMGDAAHCPAGFDSYGISTLRLIPTLSPPATCFTSFSYQDKHQIEMFATIWYVSF